MSADSLPSPAADSDPPFAAAPSSSTFAEVQEAVESASAAEQPSPASPTPPQPQSSAAEGVQSVRSPSAVSRGPESLVSGGGVSFLNGRCNVGFSYGYSTLKGRRASMEDYYDARISEVNGQMVAFFGVFDGHGGSKTAEYLKSNLFKNLCSHPELLNNTKSAIVEAFKQTDAEYLKEQIGQKKDAGSTASTALLLDHRLFVANVGDSRAVASKAGSAVALSVDHKPDRSDERQRIEDAGGFVIWAGTWRVGGVLAVSRAFGDKLLKQYVVADPEIQEHEVDGIDFVIIASDGLWNVISNKDAVSIVQDIEGAEAASRKLTEEAYLRGSSDNITCLVVHFQKNARST